MNYSELIKMCYSLSDFCRIIDIPTNGSGIKIAKSIIDENNLSTEHFDGGSSKKIKYERIKKKCPVCEKIFETKKGSRREKTTCSRSCSNTSFRSGKNNGNWKDISEYDSRSKTFILKYRKICFENHKHECVVCGENKILDVHHLDQNKFNNSPENLVPLCPTHHQYWHSRYKQEIEEKIYNYINEFKMTTLTQYQQQQKINRTD